MEVVATSLVAVLGTLFGATLTHLFQRRTALLTEQFTRSERLRQAGLPVRSRGTSWILFETSRDP